MTELSREEVLRIAFNEWCLENQILLELDESEALILFQTAYEAGAKSECAVSDRLLEALKEISSKRGYVVRSMDWSGEYYEAGCVKAFSSTADISDAAIAEVEALRKGKPE